MRRINAARLTPGFQFALAGDTCEVLTVSTTIDNKLQDRTTVTFHAVGDSGTAGSIEVPSYFTFDHA